MSVNEQMIQDIVKEVVAKMQISADVTGNHGVFKDMNEAIEAAKKSQKIVAKMSMDQREKIISNIRTKIKENAETFAHMGVQETGMGNVGHKILKHQLVAEKTPGTEDITTTAWSGDRGLTLIEMGPFGVIGAITHPSVVIYSVGNEIQEAGTKQGSWINRSLCNRFHELDATRFTTNALNGLNCAGKRLKVIMKEVIEKFGMDTQGNGSGGGSNALNSFMSLMSGEKGEFFAKHPLVTEALEECAQSCDITGLNYLSGRYELEYELHPGKTVLGTETYPADIENLWEKVTTYPHVIGDFTWTGYDYIGEAGVGIFHYDGKENFTSIYPERLGYIGDIDLIGNRRPISYFREIVYGLTNQPYIAVERMEHRGQTASKTAWMFKDNISSWTWKGHEGEKASVDVYSSGDEVELFLNGKSLGRKPAGKNFHYTATYEVAYESGTLKAVAYESGKVIGKYELSTADSVKRLKACRVTENERNVAYVKVWLEDEHGICNPQETQRRIIHAKVTGNGVLEGFGTANPSSEEDYFSDTVTTFEGSALAVVRWKDSNSKEPAVLRLWTDDEIEVCVNI